MLINITLLTISHLILLLFPQNLTNHARLVTNAEGGPPAFVPFGQGKKPSGERIKHFDRDRGQLFAFLCLRGSKNLLYGSSDQTDFGNCIQMCTENCPYVLATLLNAFN